MRLEHKVLLNRIQAPDELSMAEQLQLQTRPGLLSTLTQNGILQVLSQLEHEPPARQALLDRAYAQATTTQETPMTLIQRLFAGKPLAVRLAFASLMLLAIVALSLLLPRAVLTPGGMRWLHSVQPAFAATDGYMLLYEFKDCDPAAIQPLVEQLTATVREFKKAHNLPETEPQKLGNEFCIGAETIEKCVVKHDPESTAASPAQETKHVTAIVAVQLTDASLLDELKAELAKIPGLPEPQVTDATWFSEKGLPLPGDDAINLKLGLGNKQHAFNFPKDATEPEIEAAINEWLQQNHPDMKFDVEVKKSTEEGKTRMEIRVKSTADADPSSDMAHELLMAPAQGENKSVSSAMKTDDNSIQVTLNGGSGPHTFTFSKDATEAVMEQEIATWFAESEHKPGVKVKVTKADQDGQVKIRIQMSDQASAGANSDCQLKMEQSQTGSGETQLTLSMAGQEHTFTFSREASEQEISEQVTSWLKQNAPDKNYSVTVHKTLNEGKVLLQLELKCSETTEEK